MELFPAMPLAEWRDTKQTLHRFLQIVGKIRLAASPRRNHWWHVPFHLTGTGLTTRPMGRIDGNPIFTIDLDLVGHRLVASTVDGRGASFPMRGHSVSSFYRELLGTLESIGVHARIHIARPYDLADSGRPFVEDTEHAAYDTAAATRYWQVLSQVNLVLEEFAARFSGKTSPVHHFWHTLDIAVTRFLDRPVDQPREAGPLIREAYSREAISFGFWFGDDTVPEPAFYSYAAPEPDGITDRPLPKGAEWATGGSGHLALLRYDRVREEADRAGAVLAFYEAAYRAGAEPAGWPVDALACPHGVTDPYRREGGPWT
ncbi:DUF5996 family protein [Nocardiopsis mangrovi]|uniref:DUF5996 family protein n=1 Tax=Nocardiopsis mangrovi TaxID=1179818 RepID=A0ABV9E1H7_9ACTN